MQREKIRSGRKKDKRFEGEGGCECCISRREATWARLSNGGISAGGGSHSAGRCGISKKTGRCREGSSRSEIC